MVRSHNLARTGRAGALAGWLLAATFATSPGAGIPVARGAGPIAAAPPTTGGSLFTLDDRGEPRGRCPLEHTDVEVDISGFVARTKVVQRFSNPSTEKIEAVYTFPLPHRAAVNEMTITVGDRIITGRIKPREEAQAIYETARSSGRLSGLLDQERPNIFTQAVANIRPGEEVTVAIGYIERLNYADGAYELVFPMVVGPRYIPGDEAGGVTGISHTTRAQGPRLGSGWSYDTGQVPDAARITPPITPPGTRAGHDISITVALDSGVVLQSVHSPTHAIDVERSSAKRARITLKNETAVPNKDFILRYSVAGNTIEDALLAHRTGAEGFFTLILQPPARAAAKEITPKELVFVLDTSGSMSGFPIEKAKETMRMALAGLHPEDTFNLITFAGHTEALFAAPVSATPENLRKAQAFLASRHGRGGTEMMRAIRAALAPSDSQKHVRIVCFMTDGYVGNDMAILGEIKKHPHARVFAFGIGSSVNRFLLDEMATLGRGEVEVVGLGDDGSMAARRFHERIRSPLLTDISVDWGQLEVHEILPQRIPDLFDAKPLVIIGRYSRPAKGMVRVRGKVNGQPVSREIAVDLPDTEKRHSVLPVLWARQKIAQLMSRDFAGIQRGAPEPGVETAIAELGLEHRLLTQFTSFVAVEEMTLSVGGAPRRIEVPVEMPDGVSYEMHGFGSAGALRATRGRRTAAHVAHSPASAILPSSASGRRPAPRAELSDKAKTGAVPFTSPRSKLNKALNSLLDREPSDNPEAAFIKDGKVEVRVWLSAASHEALVELERAGFELWHRPLEGNMVIGRIEIEQLETLARLEAVRYIAPLA